jgi:hypothetical protein
VVEGLLYANARRFTKSARPVVFRRSFRKNGNRMHGDRGYCFNRTRAFIGAQSLPGIGASEEPDERQKHLYSKRYSALVY